MLHAVFFVFAFEGPEDLEVSHQAAEWLKSLPVEHATIIPGVQNLCGTISDTPFNQEDLLDLFERAIEQRDGKKDVVEEEASEVHD